MQTKAKAKSIRISPKKIRLVADLIRGMDAGEAAVQLNFSVKSAALPLAKLLKSAVSNAEENFNLDKNNLFIKEIRVDEGQTIKRWRPRAFGRATMIRKRTAQVSLVLEEKEPTDIDKQVAVKKQDSKEDIISIDDFEQIKKTDKSDIKDKETDQEVKIKKVDKKGFVNKIINRKSGQK